MPHIQIDHSPGFAARLDIPRLCEALRDAAVAKGALPLAGIRIQVIPKTSSIRRYLPEELR